MGTRVNPDSMGCVCTGEFDMNKVRVDAEIFESEKKYQKYPDTCGLGLRRARFVFSLLPEQYSTCNGKEEETGTK